MGRQTLLNRTIFGIAVQGVDVGPRSECAHYRSDLDIVAIRFKCCDTFYSCIRCHVAVAGHPVIPWPATEFDERAVLCGACGYVLTISEYLECGSRCPSCGAGFNPGCANHHPLYFET